MSFVVGLMIDPLFNFSPAILLPSSYLRVFCLLPAMLPSSMCFLLCFLPQSCILSLFYVFSVYFLLCFLPLYVLPAMLPSSIYVLPVMLPSSIMHPFSILRVFCLLPAMLPSSLCASYYASFLYLCTSCDASFLNHASFLYFTCFLFTSCYASFLFMCFLLCFLPLFMYFL